MLNSLNEAAAVFQSLAALESELFRASAMVAEALERGHKILACGNGGSACEAQHLVGELVGRYKKDRPALAALALNADGSVLSCIGNDYRFEDVYARQIEALGRPGDVLVAFTTSGTSPNVIEALRKAREGGVRTVAFLGRTGGAASALADVSLVVRHNATARIQEAHQFLLHCLMDAIERHFGWQS